MTNADGTTKAKVVNLDLRFGNLCNQKCIMCSPQHSNLWYSDWVAIGYGAPQYNRNQGVYKTTTEDAAIYSKTKKQSS